MTTFTPLSAERIKWYEAGIEFDDTISTIAIYIKNNNYSEFKKMLDHREYGRLMYLDNKQYKSLFESTSMHNNTWLHYASKCGSYECVKMLLNAGYKNWDSRNKSNKTPLHYASHEGHKNIVKLLLKAGANVNLKDNNNITPFDYAIINFNYECVQKILKYVVPDKQHIALLVKYRVSRNRFDDYINTYKLLINNIMY
jgi:ankyrin repeat protein